MSMSRAADFLSVLRSSKMFLLQNKTSGTEAGLAIVWGKESGGQVPRGEDIKFVPWQMMQPGEVEGQSLTDMPSTSSSHKELTQILAQDEAVHENPLKNEIEDGTEEKLLKPFQSDLPWHRECIVASGQSRGQVVKVYYIPPAQFSMRGNLRLGSLDSVSYFLYKHFPNSQLTPENFSFKKELLGFGFEFETVKKKHEGRMKLVCPLPHCSKLVSNNLRSHMRRHNRSSTYAAAVKEDLEVTYKTKAGTPNEKEIKCYVEKKVHKPKLSDAKCCSICQPFSSLQSPDKSDRKVSRCHLSQHKYKPTKSRKELARCYVVCERVNVKNSKLDQFGDFGPKQVCVHCGMWFTYLDGKLKRHVRGCPKFLKVEKVKLEDMRIKLKNPKNKHYAVKSSTKPKLVKSLTVKSDLDSAKNKWSEKFVNLDPVLASGFRALPDTCVSALVRKTCARLAAEIKTSLAVKIHANSQQSEMIKTDLTGKFSSSKICFTMRCQDTLCTSIKSRVFNVSIRPDVVMEKGMAAFGRQFGLNHADLEFSCKGKVLTVKMRASEVEGRTIWVKKKLIISM